MVYFYRDLFIDSEVAEDFNFSVVSQIVHFLVLHEDNGFPLAISTNAKVKEAVFSFDANSTWVHMVFLDFVFTRCGILLIGILSGQFNFSLLLAFWNQVLIRTSCSLFLGIG